MRRAYIRWIALSHRGRFVHRWGAQLVEADKPAPDTPEHFYFHESQPPQTLERRFIAAGGKVTKLPLDVDK
jgi:hypothetical protein